MVLQPLSFALGMTSYLADCVVKQKEFIMTLTPLVLQTYDHAKFLKLA